ncbi:MAG: NAD(P)-dependent alcohol dehydrogenase [Spirochaetaceae bacterium]|jgi:D-xylulose reductase|nr:NAD(P)-dependent alcohol dehydrogenase [Spirochaetaceae bacterium]
MKALVLERVKQLSLRDVPLEEKVGEGDVRVKIKACGICGSDVHYYLHGRIGDFVVNGPMILGHEAAGVVVEVGAGVTHLKAGDLVCMEPGIPKAFSAETMQGMYNLDPGVFFWATPPDHGCLRESVVHPARFCFKLPSPLTAAEGAMVEPLAIGMEAAKQARLQGGDTVAIVGAGTIGVMCALSALASGASRVYIGDIMEEKLNVAAKIPEGETPVSPVIPINTKKTSLVEAVREQTDGRGVDVVIEASGSAAVYPDFFRTVRKGGRAVLVGMPNGAVPIEVPFLQGQGIRIYTVFRYCNVYPRAIALLAGGKIDLKPFISRTFPFEDSIAAYEYAAAGHPDTVKVMIEL